MGTLWDETNETLETKSWARSWRQEFFTELGEDFRLVAHMERVITSADGATFLGRTREGSLEVTASSASTDPVLGPLAYQIQTALTAMVDELRRRKAAEEPGL